MNRIKFFRQTGLRQSKPNQQLATLSIVHSTHPHASRVSQQAVVEVYSSIVNCQTSVLSDNC